MWRPDLLTAVEQSALCSKLSAAKTAVPSPAASCRHAGRKAWLVVGIPSAPRPTAYLQQTLESLLSE